jgi:hypothetical protein
LDVEGWWAESGGGKGGLSREGRAREAEDF